MPLFQILKVGLALPVPFSIVNVQNQDILAHVLMQLILGVLDLFLQSEYSFEHVSLYMSIVKLLLYTLL